MQNLKLEIDANHSAFSSAWSAEMMRVHESLSSQDHIFCDCYRRLTSLQAWRSELLDSIIDSGPLEFFVESQNDGLVSLVLARLGSFRAALQSLRSLVENTLSTAYYMHHPIELELWHSGSHRIGFSSLVTYFRAHPRLEGLDDDVHWIGRLQGEYATLSRAVHGSAASFRMSASDTGTLLWSDDAAKCGMYSTCQRSAINCINRLLLCLFRDHLQGAAQANLRKTVSFAIAEQGHARIQEALGVHLFAPP